jgi:hypothetical protein
MERWMSSILPMGSGYHQRQWCGSRRLARHNKGCARATRQGPRSGPCRPRHVSPERTASGSETTVSGVFPSLWWVRCRGAPPIERGEQLRLGKIPDSRAMCSAIFAPVPRAASGNARGGGGLFTPRPKTPQLRHPGPRSTSGAGVTTLLGKGGARARRSVCVGFVGCNRRSRIAPPTSERVESRRITRSRSCATNLNRALLKNASARRHRTLSRGPIQLAQGSLRPNVFLRHLRVPQMRLVDQSQN